jgi:hypothetical protein
MFLREYNAKKAALTTIMTGLNGLKFTGDLPHDPWNHPYILGWCVGISLGMAEYMNIKHHRIKYVLTDVLLQANAPMTVGHRIRSLGDGKDTVFLTGKKNAEKWVHFSSNPSWSPRDDDIDMVEARQAARQLLRTGDTTFGKTEHDIMSGRLMFTLFYEVISREPNELHRA